jgi:hypothetical protein
MSLTDTKGSDASKGGSREKKIRKKSGIADSLKKGINGLGICPVLEKV